MGNAEYMGTLPLVVSNWLVVFLKDVERRHCFLRATDCDRHVDAVLALKKSGGNVIKFASNNIPTALIQSVTIAIYCFGFISVIGHQFSERSTYTRIISGYLPFLFLFLFFPFFFFFCSPSSSFFHFFSVPFS